MYRTLVKPIFDLLAATVCILLFSPLFLIIYILLAIVNRGKVFFVQKRPGKDQRIFSIVKFKTMTDKKDARGQLLPDDKRLTTVGTIIRKLSLDELPQLINVLKGDMSFVGPRPLLPQYLHLYTEEQMKRHTVKPGITGWSQVNGRNTVSWDTKFEQDVWYIRHQSFVLDFKILLLTIKKVLFSEGITAEGHATMPSFTEYVAMKDKTAQNS